MFAKEKLLKLLNEFSANGYCYYQDTHKNAEDLLLEYIGESAISDAWNSAKLNWGYNE